MKVQVSLFQLFIVFSNVCEGSRVFVVFPVPSRTHSILGDSIVKTLLDGGHEVTYVTPFPRETTARLTYINISSVLEEEIDMELLGQPSPVSYPLRRGVTYAQKALQHEGMQELLVDPTESFDLVLADWYYSGLLAPLASVYKCPLIWYSSLDLHWQSLRLVHEASSPMYTVDQNSHGLPGLPFSIWERAHQLWLQVYLTAWSYYLTNYVELPAYRNHYRYAMSIRGRSIPDYDPLVYNASMLLVNSHPPLGQVIPLPHNVKYIGGHHVELPIKSLPDDLKSVLDKAKNGAIFFRMEPKVRSNLPENIKHELVQSFGILNQTVIWNTEQTVKYLPRNIYILENAPTIGILHHPNTLMVITHGDMSSLTEAAHCGVPVIGIPFCGDQFVNVDLAVARGWAVRVEYSKHLPVELNEAIDKIIGDLSYRSNAKLVSSMFRRRTTPAHAEILHWVQLVLDTRGAKLLRSPAQHVPVTERLYLDMIISVLMVLWFLSKVLKVIRIHSRIEDYGKKYE